MVILTRYFYYYYFFFILLANLSSVTDGLWRWHCPTRGPEISQLAVGVVRLFAKWAFEGGGGRPRNVALKTPGNILAAHA